MRLGVRPDRPGDRREGQPEAGGDAEPIDRSAAGPGRRSRRPPRARQIAENRFIRKAGSPNGWSTTEASQPRST